MEIQLNGYSESGQPVTLKQKAGESITVANVISLHVTDADTTTAYKGNSVVCCFLEKTKDAIGNPYFDSVTKEFNGVITILVG